MADDLSLFLAVCGIVGIALTALGIYLFLRHRRRFATMKPPDAPPGHPPTG